MNKLVQNLVHRNRDSLQFRLGSKDGTHDSIYQPLITNEIRLAKVTYDEKSDRMSIRLTHVSLVEAPIYRAISYTWGDATDTVQIECNGHPLKITANLFLAIRKARAHSGSNWLFWADAVCVNQENIRERNQQVLLMGEIFRSANTVLVWLGEESADSDLAIETLQKVHSTRKCWRSKSPATYREHATTKLPPKGDKGWGALSSLLSRPWFNRVWVIQEVILGKQVQFLCGIKSFDFKVLRDLVNGERDQDSMIFHLPQFDVRGDVRSAVHQLWLMDTEIVKNKRGDWSHLSNLIDHCERTQTTDPRDRIYGLLGLANHPSDQGFVPDYTRTPVEVIIDFSRFVGKPLPFSRLVGWPASSDMLSGLPSWALRINPKPDSELISGSGESGSLVPQKPQTTDKLLIKASLFDTIDETSPRLRSSTQSPGEIYGLCKLMIDKLQSYPTAEEPEAMLISTILPRTTSETSVPSIAQYHKSYAAFRLLMEKRTQQSTARTEPEILEELQKKAFLFGTRLKHAARSGRFCITRRGYFGTVSARTQKDDLVYLCKDSQSNRRKPLILRKHVSFFLVIDNMAGLLRRELSSLESVSQLLPDEEIVLI